MMLNNAEELLEMYGIDFKKVKGYEDLNDINKKIFEKFIVNFYNGLGLDSRNHLVPLGIYWVEHNDHLTKEPDDYYPEDDYFVVCGSTIYAIDKDGKKTLHRKWVDENYKDYEILRTETSEYLRVEYEHYGRKEWLHVIKGGKEWY